MLCVRCFSVIIKRLAWRPLASKMPRLPYSSTWPPSFRKRRLGPVIQPRSCALPHFVSVIAINAPHLKRSSFSGVGQSLLWTSLAAFPSRASLMESANALKKVSTCSSELYCWSFPIVNMLAAVISVIVVVECGWKGNNPHSIVLASQLRPFFQIQPTYFQRTILVSKV